MAVADILRYKLQLILDCGEIKHLLSAVTFRLQRGSDGSSRHWGNKLQLILDCGEIKHLLSVERYIIIYIW